MNDITTDIDDCNHIERLVEFETIDGILEKIIEDDDALIVVLRATHRILLPHDDNILSFLRNHIGETIEIVRTDDEETPYRVVTREVKT